MVTKAFFAWCLLIVGVVTPVFGFAQPDGFDVDPRIVPPDVFVNVKDYQGAQMVTVTVRKEGYPADLLSLQCQNVGKEAGTWTRGLEVTSTNLATKEPLKLPRASFATQGLVDPKTGAMNLQPIVRAFAGARDEWRTDAMLVTFEDQSPTDQTLEALYKGGARVASQILNSPRGIEYRILLVSQDPTKIEIPSLVGKTQEESGQSKQPAGGTNPVVYILLAVAAISGGALVYFLTLRPASQRQG